MRVCGGGGEKGVGIQLGMGGRELELHYIVSNLKSNLSFMEMGTMAKTGWGGVEPTLFMLKHVENGWSGIKPTPVASKHIKNGWSGVKTTPYPSLCLKAG